MQCYKIRCIDAAYAYFPQPLELSDEGFRQFDHFYCTCKNLLKNKR